MATVGYDVHVYNARAALCVVPAMSRDGKTPTVNIEMARASSRGNEFLWDEKLIVQVTRAELPDVLAVVLGYLPGCEFNYHGERRNKGYRLSQTPSGLIVELFSGTWGRQCVAVASAERFSLATALFRQLQRQHGGISGEVLSRMHDSIYRPTRISTGG